MNGSVGGRSMVGRWIARGLALAALAVAVWFLHWTVAANGGFDDWGEADYYQLLVRGWKKGQLHLDKAPAPELLALADPYDPAQNGPHRLGDVTYFRGHYYLYFGPAPALTVLLPWSLVTGRELPMGAAVFFFCVVALGAASAVAWQIRRRYFPASAFWTAPLAVLLLAGGTHLLALAQRPAIWELPIAGGVAFTLLALLAVLGALHGRRPLVAMAAAGLCLGLAVGSRPTALPATVMLLAPVWLAWREKNPARPWWRLALAAGIPLAVCGLALATHNYARFGNPLEWGQNYQLTGARELDHTHFSLRYLPHNLALYFFEPLRWTDSFPFVQADFPAGPHPDGYFGTEELAGLATMFPLLWGLVALPLAWRRRETADRRALTVAVVVIAGCTLPVLAVVLCFFSATMRYQVDFALGLGLLAWVGWLGLERWAQTLGRAPRGAVVLVAAGATAVTVTVGALASFDYHGRAWQVWSPHRWREYEQTAARVIERVALAFGEIEGPRVLKVRFAPRPAGTEETFWRAADARTGERIVVGHIGERLIRFGYVSAATPETVWGRPLRWDPGHTHTVVVQVPSLYPENRDGRWAQVRERRDFRRRTSVAVWFSGGRALEHVVAARPAAPAGGAVGSDFSGEVRDQFRRLWREDEVAPVAADATTSPGGMLRLKLIVPERLQPRGEPLFASGARFQSSIVAIEAHGGGARFAFENHGGERVVSPVFQPRPDGNAVELTLPNFCPDAYGAEAQGYVTVRLDGQEMLRSWQNVQPFAPGWEWIGTNPFGTTCAPEFRGWIREVAWVK